ncbi:kelch-like protein 10 isoform X1 [Fundulus heteroclitus]|uniref:kelch-like protein 10 isoform X1 n=2 Tax=Fundulus heteroclitus TaxID=8078 RepID=UPI00165C9D00|nr:kelch-like protein 10 isoform X1 [Fundulus heteroclitus]
MSTASNNVWKEMFLEETLCDAVIRVRDADFKVHRLVLCEPSTYFRALFLSEQSAGQQVYSFPDVSRHVMELILEYAYTSSVVVTEDNVAELLAAAARFGVEGLIQACCDFLQGKLCSKNCINTWKLADHYNFRNLKEAAYLYILQHFEEVVDVCADFLQLSVEQLADLIGKDELNVRKESFVFEAILRWVEVAPEERKGYMPTLLTKVRLLLMPADYTVDSMCKNHLVRSNIQCMNMVISAMKILRGSGLARPPTSTRLPSHVLLAIGGFEGNHVSDKIELYNVRTDRWKTVHRSKKGLPEFSGYAYLGGNIYCVGGCDGNLYLSSVLRFNLATQTWKEVGTMHKARCYVSVVVLDERIYAMGGCDKFDTFNSVERFNPDTNQWTLIAPMRERRADAGSAVLHGKVYICGGFFLDDVFSSCECYNPETNQWTYIAHMETTRTAAGVITYNDQLYVLGGYDGRRHIADVAAYDPSSKCWHTLTPMLHPCSNFGTVVLEDQLYVVGGFKDDNDQLCSKVERYDGKTKTWHPVQDLGTPRGAVNCFTVERIPHTTAFFS